MDSKKRRKYFQALQRVTTVPEAAELWGINKTTVMYHIDKDNVVATQIGGIWVVSLQSAIDFWGKPVNLPSYDPSNPINVLQEQYKAS